MKLTETTEQKRREWQLLVDLCASRAWMATYWTLVEDGPCAEIDYKDMFDKWSKE